MKYLYTLLVVLLVVGLIALLPHYTEKSDGGEYRGPPLVENETAILADEGGGDGVQGEPIPAEVRNIVLV